MVRQARKYLVGAMSGATLIAIAIAAFVALVTTQVFTDWPIAALGKGEPSEVSSAQPVEKAATAGGGAEAGKGSAAGEGGGASGGQAGGGAGQNGGGQQPGSGGSGEAGGGEGGSGGSEGGSGGGESTPTEAPNAGGGSGSGTTSGGGGGGGSGGETASTPSGKVTSTVNETVNQVDETATGGALGETGVTQTTEEAVNGVAGPESTVGKVVDETADTVEGVLGK